MAPVPVPYDGLVCGRYALIISGRTLAEHFDLPSAPELAPRYNVAPTQRVPVVRSGAASPRELAELRWGLVPFWAKEASIGARMINARSETAASKPAFRQAMRRRRCLVAASAFYEWKQQPDGKQPFVVRFRDLRPFAFAGLWERWQPSDGDALETCTILTTSPNAVVAPLHDRMPVILDPASYDEWLAAGELSDHRRELLLAPCPPEPMEAFPVSRLVNSPANDDPACLEPLE